MTEKNIVERKPYKSPALAGILSGLPGLGAIYNGQYAKGFLFILIFAGLISMADHAAGPFPGLLLAGFIFFAIIEAVQTAKSFNRQALLENETEKEPSVEKELLKIGPSGSIFWGIVLIVLGGIFLLGNFDIINYDRIWDFWPLVVIIVGLKLIVDYFAKKNGK
jgi:TM2 domain-containing membrane protein YozV